MGSVYQCYNIILVQSKIHAWESALVTRWQMLQQQVEADSDVKVVKARVSDKYSMEGLTVLVGLLGKGDREKDQSTVRKFMK